MTQTALRLTARLLNGNRHERPASQVRRGAFILIFAVWKQCRLHCDRQ